MEIPLPTEKKPLVFFTKTFLQGGISQLFQSYIEYWKYEQQKDERVKINIGEESVIHYLVQNEEGVDIPTKEHFNNYLDQKIHSATSEAIQKINERVGLILLRNESLLDFLIEQKNIIVTIQNFETRALIKYSALPVSLSELNSTLKQIAIKYNLRTFFDTTEFSDEVIVKVNNILGFLAKKNYDEQLIMNSLEHERLIKEVLLIIKNEEYSKLTQSFGNILLNNDLLYFTFYVLYKELGKSKLRDVFVNFLVNNFLQVNVTSESLYKKFSRRPNYIPPGDWLPEIIRNYARNASPN